MNDSTDAGLLARTAGGDHTAFEELVRRHAASVYRFARAVARSEADAEDAMQEAFVAAFRHAASFRGDAAVRTWLLTIARNAAWRMRRRVADDVIDEVDEWRIAQAAGWGQTDPEQAAIAAGERERLRAALESLPAPDREILVLRELEELTGEETARVLGLSVAAMKSRLHRARLRLAAVLRAEGAPNA